MKKLFWGLFFITSSVFVVLNQFYSYPNISLLNLLLTIFIIAILITSIYKISFGGILFSLAFTCIIYSEPLHMEKITPMPVLLAALLGTIGLSIIFGKYYFKMPWHTHICKNDFTEDISTASDDKVFYDITMGSGIKYVNSEDFKTGNFKCNFGSMKVFFENTKIKEDSASINFEVSFAGVELYIPKEWKVVSKVNVTLGAVDFKNNTHSEAKKTIYLNGKVSFGAIDIIYI